MGDRPNLRSTLDDRALVVRFEQGDVARVRKRIIDTTKLYEKKFGMLDMHVLSAFIDVEDPGETEDGLRRRLVTEALDVGAPANAGLAWTCRLHALDEMNLRVIKHGLPGEAPHHYCLDFGGRPDRHRVEDFVQRFSMSKETP